MDGARRGRLVLILKRMSGPTESHLEDRLFDEAVEYFSTAFPNPSREGCPHPERLRALASSAAPVTEPVRAHLFGCSECFREFRRQRLAVTATSDQAKPGHAARIHGMGVRAMVAAVASFALAAGLAHLMLWRGVNRYRQRNTAHDGAFTVASIRPHDESSTIVAVVLQPSTVRRGTPTALESAVPALSIPSGRVRFDIQLPDGYPEGVYQLAIVNPLDEPLVDASASAVGRSLIVVLDAAGLDSGRRFLRLQRAGEPPDYVPILIGPVR